MFHGCIAQGCNPICCVHETPDGRPDELAEAITELPESYGRLAIDRNEAGHLGGSISLAAFSKVVEIKRAGPHWRVVGLLVKPGEDDCLHVEEVLTPSLISLWNESETDEFKKVRKGDTVKCINGEVTVDGMLRILMTSAKGSMLRLEIE
mmetsp:Transcript_81727/g.243710  ORF Transcript_81727/g.243710 Transcript_81727/m.243710 type:complete len:150 (+) Transcript_81727:113-562(+)